MGSFRAVFGLPGARSLFAAGLIGRLGFAAITLSALLFLAERFDGFTVAGAAVAGFGITAGLLAPARGRILDRTGPPGLVVMSGAFWVLLFAASLAPATWPALVVGLATLGGVVAPPVSAVTRRGWSALLGDAASGLRTAAFSADSVGEESTYVAGPALAGLGVATLGQVTTYVLALTAVAVGGIALSRVALGRTPAAAAPADDPEPEEPPPGAGPPAAVDPHEHRLRGAGLAAVLRAGLSVAGLGAVIGLIDVAVPGLATAAGSPALGGVLLAVYTGGSVIGVLLAAMRPATDPDRRRVLLGLVQIVALLPLTVVREPLPLAIALVVAGLPIGPLLVTAYLLVDRDVPLAAATQAYAWVTTASNTLASLAVAIGGLLVDSTGPGVVLVLTPFAAAASGIPAALLLRHDRRVAA